MAWFQDMVTQNRSDDTNAIRAKDLESWFESEGFIVHQSRLKKILVLYGRPSGHPGLPDSNEFDFLNCSWDDVLNQLESAKSEDPTFSRKASRKSDRVLADAAPYMQPWIELIPEEYGLSIIKGGLALIFSSAKHKVENRERILRTFEDIPDIIRTMEAACKLFGPRDGEDVAGLAKSYYDELCQDIPDLIQILHEKRPRLARALNRLAAGMPEMKKVDDILNRLQQRSTALSSSISRIKMRLAAKSKEDLEAIRHKVDQAYAGMGMMYGHLRQMPTRKEMERYSHSFQGIIVAAVRKEVESGVQKILNDQAPGELAADIKMLVLMMSQEISTLKGLNSRLQSQSLQIEPQRSRQSSPRPLPWVSSFELLRILDVDPTSFMEDLGFIVRQESRMSGHDKARARWLLKTTSFQSWFKTLQSSLLLVDGTLRLDKISPMSVLAGTLSLSLLDQPNTQVLHFFCGSHLDSQAEDGLTGPHGMLRSLVVQLLLSFKAPLPDLSEIDSQEFLHDVYDCTLPALCELFRLLVGQVPSGITVFCLIDGISCQVNTEVSSEGSITELESEHTSVQGSGSELGAYFSCAGER
ncbi:hypothetical protein JX265_011638 [Neoarthrinium moseri]|uniref:Nephrocystin 3-like N-terminal domain-containing protein n=1 Tax=Neoarthrinium moseri TaxID=1658444 RepID=A0A9P9WBW0_9PEZI|nr:hypothetical protein JX265_011638 [Neoarthrinium moseri]